MYRIGIDVGGTFTDMVSVDDAGRVALAKAASTPGHPAPRERQGARVGPLPTEGHRDVIEMREGLKPDRYNLRVAAPEPLVPRARRLGVRERLRADGGGAGRPAPRPLGRAVDRLRRDGVEAVAVCYLHAYRDGRHEAATAEALARALPDVYVSLSSLVLPQIKEYERVSTTVVNAYVGPALSRYLSRLHGRLAR